MQLFTLLTCVSIVSASSPCPISGPVFPAVKNLNNASTLHTALDKIRSQFDHAFKTGKISTGVINPNDTYSMGIFSVSDTKPLFEYYHRGADLLNSTGPIGGDSVFRIGSTTKLLTVYLLLLEAGDSILHDPMTKYLTELKGKDNWDEITVGTLASHLAGLAADLVMADAFDPGNLGVVFPDGGFPPLGKNETSPCIADKHHCSREELLEALQARPRTYLPNTTPAYSNTEFLLLGAILKQITGKSYEEVLQRALVKPLNLKGTTSSVPESLAGGVIIGDPTSSGWDSDFMDMTAEGGGFSSANDLAAIGRAILSSSLLSPNITRAWMKPSAFTSSLLTSVGMPWEIFRANYDEKNNHIVDIYTKSGQYGVYTATLALIPEYDVGFAVLVASAVNNFPFSVNELISETLLPALEDVGREEANARFAGTYTASNINSTVTLSTTPGKPGLKIDRWISNSTNDIFKAMGNPEDFRAYLTNIESKDGSEVHWRALATGGLGATGNGPFASCVSWLKVDRPTWGLWGVDDFTFHLGEDGKAKSLELKALQVVLEKQ